MTCPWLHYSKCSADPRRCPSASCSRSNSRFTFSPLFGFSAWVFEMVALSMLASLVWSRMRNECTEHYFFKILQVSETCLQKASCWIISLLGFSLHLAKVPGHWIMTPYLSGLWFISCLSCCTDIQIMPYICSFRKSLLISWRL